MKCKKCGAKIDGDSYYCEMCGAKQSRGAKKWFVMAAVVIYLLILFSPYIVLAFIE